MSLTYGYEIRKADDPGDKVMTITTSIAFTKYNNRRIVKVFNSGHILLGIVTTSARIEPPHDGLVFYDFCDKSGTNVIKKINTDRGNYFRILNKNSADSALGLKSAYTVPKACSITAKLATRSKGNPRAGGAPPGPVTLNITLYYVEVPAHEY